MTMPAPNVPAELKVLPRNLKLRRAARQLARASRAGRQHDHTHNQFPEQLFSDEVQRLEATPRPRARTAKLDTIRG